MRRCFVLFAIGTALMRPGPCLADAFDHYTNPVLAKVPTAAGVKELKKLTPALILEHDRVLPGNSAALVVVETNDGLRSKLLVQAACYLVCNPIRTPRWVLCFNRPSLCRKQTIYLL